MKTIFILGSIFISVFLQESQSLAAQNSISYEYHEKTLSGDVVEKQYVQVEDLYCEQKLYKRKIEGNNYVINEQFVLEADYQTQSWQVSCLNEDTGYAGEKRDNELFIKGAFKSEIVDKKIRLDSKPFYYTPKFSLTGFVLSDSKQIKFWMLRKDRLTKYLMQAKKIGEEVIVINGKETEVIKVYCSAAGFGERFYKRIYFFRKSDGFFVRGEHPDISATATVLVSEDAK